MRATDFLLKQLLLSLLYIFFIGCSQDAKPPRFDAESSINDIIFETQAVPKSIDIDIYLDATTSMKGYAKVKNSVYSKFLDELESGLRTSWSESNIKFFKFGTGIREINREEYKSAEANDAFYSEKGIFEQTNIDKVIDKTSQDRVSLVITDLFQTEGDVLKVVEELKNRCLGKDIDLAILGIKSEYNGTIYDAKVPPFKLNTENNPELKRAFYAIIFGNGPNIEHLFKTLKQSSLKNHLDEKYFTVISSKDAVKGFQIEIVKPEDRKKDRSIVIKKKTDRQKDELVFDAVVTDISNPIPIVVNINLDSGYYPPIGDFIVKINRKAVFKNKKEVILEEDIKDIIIKNKVRNSSNYNLDLELTLPPKTLAISYEIVFLLPQLNAFAIPDWVVELSSQNPTPESDQNKTLNLDRFIRDLLRSAATINEYKVAKGYLNIRIK